MSAERPLIIIGAGGHAKVVIDALLSMGMSLKGATDQDPSRLGKSILGVDVIGDDGVLDELTTADIRLVLGVGSTEAGPARRKIFDNLKDRGYEFANVVHPSAVIGRDVEIGEGAQIMAGAVIQPGCRIGRGVIVNTGARVDHDCTLGDFVHISPGAVLSGDVTIGDDSHIGCGATVLQGQRVGRSVTVGAGAVVVSHIIDDVCVVGIPARETKNA
ncbi:MAG: acetyltransferase [Rhodospirillales bacterium]